MLAFFPWNEDGKWHLNPPAHILSTGKYGNLDVGDLPGIGMISVPVIIDDKARTLTAGALLLNGTDEGVNPSFDYVVVEPAPADIIVKELHPCALKWNTDGAAFCLGCGKNRRPELFACKEYNVGVCKACKDSLRCMLRVFPKRNNLIYIYEFFIYILRKGRC